MDLYLAGKAGNPIWLMEDGEEPHVIGIRLDCGDSGVIYVTREQAMDLAKQLMSTAAPDPPRAIPTTLREFIDVRRNNSPSSISHSENSTWKMSTTKPRKRKKAKPREKI